MVRTARTVRCPYGVRFPSLVQPSRPSASEPQPSSQPNQTTTLCGISEVVSGHGLKWFVSGVAPTGSIIEQFVDSFKPIVASG